MRRGLPRHRDRGRQPRRRSALGGMPDGSGTWGRNWLPAYSPAALYFSMTSAGTRPRSLMSMPAALAHARTLRVSCAPSPRRPGDRAVPCRRPCGYGSRTRRAPCAVPRCARCSGRSRSPAVQAELDRPLGWAAVDVVDKQSLDLLGHMRGPDRFSFRAKASAAVYIPCGGHADSGNSGPVFRGVYVTVRA
jgi:hypothetical protein